MTPHDLIRLGFAPVEVAHATASGACSCYLGDECRAPGKHPLGKNWLASAVASRELRPGYVPAYARLAPATSWGMIPPAGSRLIVIDRDDPAVLLPLPPTFEVHRASAPPRKGHYVYRLADDISEDEVPRGFAGGDVRVASSGHVVGIGSRHRDGDLYEGNDLPVGLADRELIDALSELKPVRRDAEGAVEAVEGSRHAWLVGQAAKRAKWGWDEEDILEALQELNDTVCDPPLPEVELPRMAEWAARNVNPDEIIVVARRRA